MLFRNGTHLIDAATMFAESEPVWVIGQLDAGHEQYGPYYAGEGGATPRSIRVASALIRYENGVIASIFCSKPIYSQTFIWEVIVYCEGGSIQITGPGGIELMTMAGEGIRGRSRTPVETPLYRWTEHSGDRRPDRSDRRAEHQQSIIAPRKPGIARHPVRHAAIATSGQYPDHSSVR